MYCRRCGNPIVETDTHCRCCGESVAPPAYAHHPTQTIPNYLAHAIVLTLFCCVPFGIVAIVYAAQVSSKIAVGDIPGALECSNKAKTWCWWAFGIGLVIKPASMFVFIAANS